MKFAIFSGRFDPCHIAHVQSIVQIAERFDAVIVPILDYPERITDAYLIKGVFETLFKNMAPLCNVVFIVNNIHFGRITFTEYNMFINEHIGSGANVTYLSGNEQVIVHMKDIGVKRCEFFHRFMDNIYTGTKIRKEMRDNDE